MDFIYEFDEKGNTIGRGHIVLIYNNLHTEPYALIEDIWVEESYRNKGIGKNIVSRLIDQARDSGCYKIIATSRFLRENVHRFYEDLGFEKWGYEFRIDL